MQAPAKEVDTMIEECKSIPASNKKVTPVSTIRPTAASNKENTPAAANKQRKEPKRKSDTKSSHPSTG